MRFFQPGLFVMPLHFRPLRCAAALALATLAWPVVAGIVDFSPGLLAWVSNKWGKEVQPRLTTWQRLVRDTRPLVTPDSKGDATALKRTNGFFNQMPYVNDIRHWGVEDYWATPVEFLGSFAGDCEDYSIAKFLTLKDLGIPLDKLRITYVRAITIGEPHMVLAYYPTPDAEPFILDNLIGDIKPASQRTDLEPVYSFNEQRL
jgi:predicted transglutaminase-like cysteine proteinase